MVPDITAGRQFGADSPVVDSTVVDSTVEADTGNWFQS
jgi:hypothetical protein